MKMRRAQFADKSASASRRRALPQPTEQQRHNSNWRTVWTSIELETGTYQGAAPRTSRFAALVLIAVRPFSVQGGRGRWKGCAELHLLRRSRQGVTGRQSSSALRFRPLAVPSAISRAQTHRPDLPFGQPAPREAEA